ncbi:hypothetical protein RZS08_09715, partial [Arthrospira platensis SPKY1]|nr:hypothetical protein [Arthrospira platensis SPKY1]
VVHDGNNFVFVLRAGAGNAELVEINTGNSGTINRILNLPEAIDPVNGKNGMAVATVGGVPTAYAALGRGGLHQINLQTGAVTGSSDVDGTPIFNDVAVDGTYAYAFAGSRVIILERDGLDEVGSLLQSALFGGTLANAQAAGMSINSGVVFTSGGETYLAVAAGGAGVYILRVVNTTAS